MPSMSRRDLIALAAAAAMPAIPVDAAPREAGRGEAAKLPALTLAEASAAIQGRTATSTDLVKALLDRINALNPLVNCYITVMATEALAQAAKLDAELSAGRSRGPLHGVPIALKDNIDTAGVRTTAASPMFKDRVPGEDAEIVRRLKAAGAVIIGKLNLHEFAFGCTGDISYFGPARNPWSLDRVTGGSSSGSGGAVAARLAFGALGTDTGGSIRVPSAWCGVVGLKPTVGLVSIRGIVPCSADLDHCGPMARTVEDVAIMLGPMAGYDEDDIFSVESRPQDYLAAMRQPVSGFRLSAPASYYDHIDPEIAPAVMAALNQLARMTAGITSRAPLWEGPGGGAPGDADFYHHDLIEKYGLDYMAPDNARLARLAEPGDHGPSAAEDARAHQMLQTARRRIDRVFKDFDLVVVPTVRIAAPKINDGLAREMERAKAKGAEDAKVYDFFAADVGCTNTRDFDAFGIPAISVPCGFTAKGLPVGIMIAGPHFAEGRVLALAHAYEQATPWRNRAPNLTPHTPVPPIEETGGKDRAP